MCQLTFVVGGRAREKTTYAYANVIFQEALLVTFPARYAIGVVCCVVAAGSSTNLDIRVDVNLTISVKSSTIYGAGKDDGLTRLLQYPSWTYPRRLSTQQGVLSL